MNMYVTRKKGTQRTATYNCWCMARLVRPATLYPQLPIPGRCYPRYPDMYAHTEEGSQAHCCAQMQVPAEGGPSIYSEELERFTLH